MKTSDKVGGLTERIVIRCFRFDDVSRSALSLRSEILLTQLDNALSYNSLRQHAVLKIIVRCTTKDLI